MSEVNKVNEDIVALKIALLESKVLKEISEKQQEDLENFVEKSQKAVELFLDALASENISSTAIKGFLEKAEEKQREYLEKIQSGSLKPKDEQKAIENIKKINGAFAGFAAAMKNIPKAGITIKDYKKILKKELEDSRNDNRTSKKMSELFPNDYQKFSAALSSSFKTKISVYDPVKLGIPWDTNAVVSEFVNMPVKALNRFTGKVQNSEPPPTPPTPAPPGSPPTPAAPDVKIKDIFKGANEQDIKKFNEKFKEKFGFELSDKDDLAAILASMT
jgi:uncharacterized membrane protein YheB (UPF0754 family)